MTKPVAKTDLRRARKIDSHPNREEILAALINGVSDTAIGKKYGISRSAVNDYKLAPEWQAKKRRLAEEAYKQTVNLLARKLVDKVTILDKIHDALANEILNKDGTLKHNKDKYWKSGRFAGEMKLVFKAQEVYGQQLIRLEALGFGIVQSEQRVSMEEETNELVRVILKALEPFKEAKEAVIAAVKRSH